jgi:hypothetical protein
MFHFLEDAVAVAIPGDTIEIRTNRPMLVGGAEVRVKEKVKDAPLTIRAGRRYEPVLRAGSDRPMVKVTNVDLKLVGLHFAVATHDVSCLDIDNCGVTAERCTVTGLLDPLGKSNSIWLGTPARGGAPRRVLLDHCLLRGRMAALRCAGADCELTFRDSAVVGGQMIYITNI